MKKALLCCLLLMPVASAQGWDDVRAVADGPLTPGCDAANTVLMTTGLANDEPNHSDGGWDPIDGHSCAKARDDLERHAWDVPGTQSVGGFYCYRTLGHDNCAGVRYAGCDIVVKANRLKLLLCGHGLDPDY